MRLATPSRYPAGVDDTVGLVLTNRQVIKSTPDLDFVLHTASPFHFNVQDLVKDFLEPAVTGTTSILQAIKDNAPSVKRVVITSSFAAINHGSDKKPPFYDETCWNPITWDEAAQDKTKAYRGSKVRTNTSLPLTAIVLSCH